MPRDWGDPSKRYWVMQDIAACLNLPLKTVWEYRGRGLRNARKRAEPGFDADRMSLESPELPPEDEMFGRTPAWRPATINAWITEIYEHIRRRREPAGGPGSGPSDTPPAPTTPAPTPANPVRAIARADEDTGASLRRITSERNEDADPR